MLKKTVSEKWVLIKEDLLKVGTGLLLGLAGATVAFLGGISGVIDYSHYGQSAPVIQLVVASIASSVINLIRKYITLNTYTE